MIITFCGHAQYIPTNEDEQKTLSLLLEKTNNSPADLFLGDYGAFDMFAQRCGRKYQKIHPATKLILVTPYMTAQHQPDLYDEILYPPLESVPLRLAISRRNKWMVEQADLIIAYINHSWGGAYQTFQYAKQRKKQIYNIADKVL